ncbi:MAG: rhodanese-like domain-containing protein [Myxococcota bacterium]
MHIQKGYAELVEAAEAEVETLSPAEAAALQTSGEAYIIDVRDVRERARGGFIPQALHMPRGMLEFWVDPASPYHKPVFQEDRRFILHCASGWRSALAAKALKDMGLQGVAHLGGGFKAWQAEGLPVSKD